MTTPAARTWLITATVPIPTHITVKIPPEVGDQLQVASRIRPKTFEVEGRKILFQRGPDWPTALRIDSQLEPAEIVAIASGGDPDDAIGELEPTLEVIVETLAFQLQFVVPIWCLDAFDMAAPAKLGERRQGLHYPMTQGRPVRTFRPAEQKVEGVYTELYPDPSRILDVADHRIERALDWYLKGLAAQFAADQFICWSIAAELLMGASGIDSEAPYTPQCGHTLHECPTCDKPTTKKVFGASMRRFFSERGGLDSSTSRKLWNARQIVHGNVPLDSVEFRDAMGLCQILRSVVGKELKVHLGIPADTAPIVEPEGLTVMSYMSVHVEHPVSEEHLTKLAAIAGLLAIWW